MMCARMTWATRAADGSPGSIASVTVAERDEQLVVVREQVDDGPVDRGGGGRARRDPERSLPLHLADERRRRELQALAGVRLREPRPPSQVGDLCRAVALDVASGELGECLVPLPWPARRDALLEQGVGLLPALARSAADEALELRIDEHVAEPQVGPGDARVRERPAELLAGHRPAAGEQPLDDRAAPCPRLEIELEGPVLVRARLLDARRGQRQQPPDVRGVDEVPRRAQDVRPDELARVKPRVQGRLGRAVEALGERPFGTGVVLRLDREQAPDRRSGGREGRACQSLRAEPSPGDRLGGPGVRQG